MESAEEIPSIINYYNGADKLNTLKVNCEIFTEKDCYSNSMCGWCITKKQCIVGNFNGPLDNCPDNGYVFTNPLRSNLFNPEPDNIMAVKYIPPKAK
ncbi:MAG: hypothetical protein MJ252_28600 [archaeon]|nr:hypothetical protein [archaeon]